MTIARVQPQHLPAIEDIEKACFTPPWTRLQLEHQMNAGNCLFLAALDAAGAVMGYVGLMYVLDEGYISNIAVAPDFRRRGVADTLLIALVHHAKALSLSFLTLEVRESNEAAIHLYAKHGFAPVGRRQNYYDKPKEDALLMTLFFHEAPASLSLS